jgi:dienelactone hydrolase
MTRVAWTLTVLTLASASARGDDAPRPDGVWAGRCRIADRDVYVVLRLKEDGGRLDGAAFSRALALRNAPVSCRRDDGRRLTLSFATEEGPVRLVCDFSSPDRLTGTAEFSTATGECSFWRRYPVDKSKFDQFRGDYRLDAGRVLFIGRFQTADYLFLADGDSRHDVVPIGPDEFLTDNFVTIKFETAEDGEAVAATVTEAGRVPRRAPRVKAYDTEAVSYTSGDVRLSGTVFWPATPGPHPAVVCVHGSGPGLRESYTVEADRLAREGIAVLTFDKRGSGASTGDWTRVGFDELAGDVLAGVHFLRQDKRIRADKIGLFGGSQAGWVIPLAASRSSDVAFIIPFSGGAVTPAEQELWRQRQNLAFLNVPARFVELERKAAAMVYDWQWRYQSGLVPLPNPFTDDNLNMFHDAPDVLRRVRQPVLAIFGGRDTLTPPRESAAVWAESLRRRGDDDFSVRLFPTGTHGLLDCEKTGSPLEILPEIRWVPGYFETVIRWIHHHTGGPAFPDARRVDVDADPVPVESRGMHHIAWYGSGAVQPWQLLASAVAFASAALAVPVAWLWRRLRPTGAGPPPASRMLRWSAALLGLLNLGILAVVATVLNRLVEAKLDPTIDRLRLIWNAVAGAEWLSLGLTVLVAVGCVAAWRNNRWSRAGRLYYTAVALVAVGWVPFALYWDFLWPVW